VALTLSGMKLNPPRYERDYCLVEQWFRDLETARRTPPGDNTVAQRLGLINVMPAYLAMPRGNRCRSSRRL
jgi:hypothetical protein